MQIGTQMDMIIVYGPMNSLRDLINLHMPRALVLLDAFSDAAVMVC